MTVLFGTLGWRPQSLVPSIRSTEGLEKLVFHRGSHGKSQDARPKVVDFCRLSDSPRRAVEILGSSAASIDADDKSSFAPLKCAIEPYSAT